MKSKIIIIIMALTLLPLSDLHGAGKMSTRELTFKGKASGGTLIFGNALTRDAKFVSINTLPNESPKSVVNRLADAILASDVFVDWIDDMDADEFAKAKGRMALGNTLTVPAGLLYFIAGTEIGLGIPKPVTSVSASYNSSTDSIDANWVNPSSDKYDQIIVLFRWYDDAFDRPEFRNRRDLADGAATNFSIPRILFSDIPPVNIDDLDVWVIGFRESIPSNAAGVHLSNSGSVQEELYGIPFTNGLAPNWNAWGHRDSAEIIPEEASIQGRKRETIEEFVRRGKTRFRIFKKATAKPYEQILKVSDKGGKVGCWRGFFGLTAGHKYRLTARLNTFEMTKKDKDWSYSLHMTYNKSKDAELSSEQMGGLAFLPDGRSGLNAGMIAEFNSESTTDSQYVERSGEITLPAGVDSITVWVRHSAGKATSGVGIDWVKLEDLGK